MKTRNGLEMSEQQHELKKKKRCLPCRKMGNNKDVTFSYSRLTRQLG